MVDVTRESMLKLFNENIAKGEALLASNDPRLNKYVGVTTDRGMGLVLEGDTFRLLPPEGDCAKWRAYEQAIEPKKLVILPGGHFGAYTGPDFELSSGAARDWLVQHLRP